MRLLLTLPLVLVLTAAGCGTPRPIQPATSSSSLDPEPSMSTVTPGEPFALERRASVLVDGHRLRFDAIVEDSRCPADVTCVWEGRAIASFTFTGSQSVDEVRLELSGYVDAETPPQDNQRVVRDGYTFTLLALDPYPGTAEADGDAVPTATLSVEPVAE